MTDPGSDPGAYVHDEPVIGPATPVVGVDVGGTTIKAVLLGADETVLADVRTATPPADPSGRETADTIADLVRQLAAVGPVAGVGLAVPGIVDPVAGYCREAVNLGWRDVPIRDLVGRRLGRPVSLIHDVRAGALAERLSGAGRDQPGAMAFLAIGTGIALVLVDETGQAMGPPTAGEVGQLRRISGPDAGARFEELASAAGIARRAGRADAREVAAAAQDGDTVALRAWTEAVDVLGQILAWTIALAAPATVVVGGGLAQAGAVLFEPLHEQLSARFPGAAVALRPAEHGTAAAAIGAALLARRSGSTPG